MHNRHPVVWDADEYLEYELRANTRHEYIDGQVYAMAGGSPRHNQIAANALIEIGVLLRGRGCRLFNSDQRVQVASTFYTYPDATVLCGEGEFGRGGTLHNPTMVVEVLSPSTEEYDRGAKLSAYKRLASLQAILLVAQDVLHVACHWRDAQGVWRLTEAIDAGAQIAIPPLNITAEVSALYSLITF
jgi:Uma2 family endonuclease